MLSRRLETAASAILTVAAVAVAVSVVYDVFIADRSNGVRSSESVATRYVSEWQELLKLATQVNGAGNQVTVLEFTDFECPACRQFETSLETVKPELLAKMSLSLLHLPLPYHRFALPSAVAFECATRQGRAKEMKQILFAQQDSLGLLSWQTMAARASVADSAQFGECVEARPDLTKIQAGEEMARRLGVRGTPTIVINGWMLGAVPSASDLERLIAMFARGENPFPELQ